MNVTLVVEKSEGYTGRDSITLEGAETVVGRHRDCSLRIPMAEISRRHCILHLHDDHLTVEDLDSLNGTYINGERVQGTQPVHPGDRLEIGPVIFAVVVDGIALVPLNSTPVPVPGLVSESATVDIKPADTGFLGISPPRVVAVEPVEAEAAKADV